MGAICGTSKESRTVRQSGVKSASHPKTLKYQTMNDSAKNSSDAEENSGTDREDKDFRKLIRSFTRRSVSTTARMPSMLSSASSEFREGSRRPSIIGGQQQIDDNDVIRLIAIKGNDEDAQKIKDVCSDDLFTAPAEKVPTEVLERARERRKTMEKLNVFSPDLIDDARLSELYDASEHLYRHNTSSREQVKSTA